MPATVVVGLQWGDEGKGKIIDLISDVYDIVVRYQGGDNAGHTVIVGDEKYALHLIPSGVIKGKKVVLGNGMVINPISFLQEVNDLRSRGLKVDVAVSERAHIITPEAVERDKGLRILHL